MYEYMLRSAFKRAELVRLQSDDPTRGVFPALRIVAGVCAGLSNIAPVRANRAFAKRLDRQFGQPLLPQQSRRPGTKADVVLRMLQAQAPFPVAVASLEQPRAEYLLTATSETGSEALYRDGRANITLSLRTLCRDELVEHPAMTRGTNHIVMAAVDPWGDGHDMSQELRRALQAMSNTCGGVLVGPVIGDGQQGVALYLQDPEARYASR